MSKPQHIFCLFVFDRKTFLPRPCLEKSFMIISCLTFPKSSTCACFLEKATVSCCTRWLVSCLTRFIERETGGLKPTCAPLKLVWYAWSQYFYHTCSLFTRPIWLPSSHKRSTELHTWQITEKNPSQSDVQWYSPLAWHTNSICPEPFGFLLYHLSQSICPLLWLISDSGTFLPQLF